MVFYYKNFKICGFLFFKNLKIFFVSTSIVSPPLTELFSQAIMIYFGGVECCGPSE